MPMKKFCAMLCAFVLVIVLGLPVAAEGINGSAADIAPDIMAPAAYVVNLDTNIVVYEKNSETPLQAASLTKMMTTLLLLENYQDQLDTISVTAPSYIYDLIWEKTTNASTADIRKGETQTLRNLLYAMMLPSANEAALAVAELIGGGSSSNFVAMMNARAKDIGCTNTVFVDACGLDEGNLTTARDMYLILRYAMSFDLLKEVVKTPLYNMGLYPRYMDGSYNIRTTDMMIASSFGGDYYRSYAQGGKTGSLGEWQNFACWHVQDGETYISVVLNSPESCDPYTYPTKRPALYETGKLMDWVYDSFSLQSALDVGQAITEVKVKYSTQADTLRLYPADSMYTILPSESDSSVTQKTFHLPDSVAAPIKQGDVVGTVTLSLSGEVIGTVDLIAERDIARNPVLFVVEKIGEFFGSLYFRVVVILTVIAVALYLAWYVWYWTQHRNSR